MGASASLAAFAAASADAAEPVPGGTHLVEQRADFDESNFDRIVGRPADIRQLFEAVAFHPQVLGNVKNALNGLSFGFGYRPDRISIAFCPHGQSASYCYTDYIWKKYNVGEALKLKDAQGKTVVSNVYLEPSHAISDSNDPNDPTSIFQDTSIQTLQKRGVVFTTCHTAVEEQARMLVRGGFGPAGSTATDVANDILTHLIPGALVVPSMVGAIAVMQARYKYTYITVGL